MTSPDLSRISASDDDLRRAEFARMLAENAVEWLGSNRQVAHSGISSSTVAAGEDEKAMPVESVSGDINTIQLETARPFFQAPNEFLEIDAENEKLNIEIDQLRKQLNLNTSAYNQALKRIKLQEEQLEKKTLAHEEALRQIRDHQDEVVVLRSRLNTLRDENHQLKESTTTVTNLIDRIERLYIEKDSAKDQIQCMSEERLRLKEDLRHKHDEHTQLQQKVLQSDEQLFSLQHQLGNMSTVQTKFNNKVTEVKTLQSNVDVLGTQNTAQAKQLDTTRAKLTQFRKINKGQTKEIIALKSQVDTHQRNELMLKYDIAFFITQLDLADAGCRVFTCHHDDMSSVNDGNKSTSEKGSGVISGEMFRDWAYDQEFMDSYAESRQNVIVHHREHEYDAPGRGDWSHRIKDICTYPFVQSGLSLSLTVTVMDIDYSRGVHHKYN